jgi:hypothetical protein
MQDKEVQLPKVPLQGPFTCYRGRNQLAAKVQATRPDRSSASLGVKRDGKSVRLPSSWVREKTEPDNAQVATWRKMTILCYFPEKDVGSQSVRGLRFEEIRRPW